MFFLEKIILQSCTDLSKLSVVIFGIAFLCNPPTLLAQEEDDQAIEVIVVTAQKREQSVLEVPFAI